MAFDVSKKVSFIMSLAGDDKVKAGVQGVTEGLWDADRAVGLAQKAFIGLFGVASAAAFVSMVKGGIDGAAAMHDLSQKTGMSVAALQAFGSVGAFTGTTADAIASSSAKLSKNLATVGDEGKGAGIALKAMGIDFDAFKAMTPEQQMMAVAVAMGQFNDGTNKTAASMLLFGKQGAEMLPFLNDLAKSHEQVTAKLTDEQVALKATQAAMADAFGDNLTKIRKEGDAWKKDLSMGLLPALWEASEAVLGMSNGAGGLKEQISKLAKDGTLAEWARGAMTALSYLVDVAQGLFSLIPMLGHAIAGVAASTAALFGGFAEGFEQLKSGNVMGAFESVKKGFSGVGTIASETGSRIADIWGQKLLGATFRDRMADLEGTTVAARGSRREMENLSDVADRLKAQRDAEAASARAAEAAQRKLREEYERAVKAGAELVAQIDSKEKAAQLELDTGRKLTKAEQELLELEAKLASGKVVLTGEQEKHTRAVLANTAEIEKNIRWMDDSRKANDAARQAVEKGADEIDRLITAQRNTVDAIGLSKAALAEHEAALIDDKAAALDARAAMLDLIDPAVAEELRRQAGQWRELANLKRQAFDKTAANESIKAWQAAGETIVNNLTDAMRGGWRGVWSYIRSMAASEGIQFLVKPVMSAGLGAMGALLPGSASAGGAGGAAGELGGLANLGSLFGAGGMMGTLGSFGATGFMSTLAGTGLGTSLGAAGALIEGGSVMGGIGMGLGAVAPYLLAVAALASLATKSTPHVGGYASADASGNVSAITRGMVGQGDFMYQVMQSINPETQTATEGMAGLVSQILNAGAAGFGGGGAYSVRAGFASDNNDGSRALLDLTGPNGIVASLRRDFDKDPTKGFKEFTAAAAGMAREVLQGMDLPKWASDTLDALGASPSLENLAGAVAQINAARVALANMVESVTPLGGAFSRLAGLSSDAQMQLAGFAGGIEAFLQKTAAYVGSYYSEQEQMALKAAGILKTVGAAGIDATGATRKDQLRALMDALDPSREADRKQMAALLNVAQDYSTVSAYLEKQGLTLGELAAAAPQVSALQELKTPTETTAEATQKTADGVEDVATNTSATAEGVTALVQGQEEQTGTLAAGLSALKSTLDEAVALLRRIDATTTATAGAPS